MQRAEAALTIASNAVLGINLLITDDSNSDGLPDWWGGAMVQSLTVAPGDDSDKDGLSNSQEFNLSLLPGLSGLNPMNWDSDGDGMDDNWDISTGPRAWESAPR